MQRAAGSTFHQVVEHGLHGDAAVVDARLQQGVVAAGHFLDVRFTAGDVDERAAPVELGDVRIGFRAGDRAGQPRLQRDLDAALRLARGVRAGTVAINGYSEGDITTPFGGYRTSGFGGRDNGLEAFEQYTETKTIWVTLR